VRTAESIHPNLRAAFWMLGTITGFTSMAVAGRIVRQELDTFELMMFRSFVGIIVVVSFALITRTTGQIVPRKLGLHSSQRLPLYGAKPVVLCSAPDPTRQSLCPRILDTGMGCSIGAFPAGRAFDPHPRPKRRPWVSGRDHRGAA